MLRRHRVVATQSSLTLVADGLDHGVDGVVLEGAPEPNKVGIGQAEVGCRHRHSLSGQALSFFRRMPRFFRRMPRFFRRMQPFPKAVLSSSPPSS
jgi:hypothetical protein